MTHTPYYEAVREAEDDLAEALRCIRAEEDDDNITPAAAAAERVGLLERHATRLRELRREYLSPAAPASDPPESIA